MVDIALPNNHDDTPVYTIKTVVHETGIKPATLRAWERRYGCLLPGRSEGGYRLYSERDIATLRWLKQQVDAGVSISRAVALLEIRHSAEARPAGAPGAAPVEPHRPTEGVRVAASIVDDLLQALLAYDEAHAEAILNEAFALHPVEAVAEEVFAPTLAEIGERWYRGEVSIIQEHFATAFLRHRLIALFNAYPQSANGPLALAGSGPEEWHDVGILMAAIALRRHGWRVIYLGQNVPADQLADQIRTLRPAAVCLSATTLQSAAALVQVHLALAAMPEPRPMLILGGRAFNLHPELRTGFPGALFPSSARELITGIASSRTSGDR